MKSVDSGVEATEPRTAQGTIFVLITRDKRIKALIMFIFFTEYRGIS